MQSFADYMRQLEDPVFKATNRHALAELGIDITLFETYRVSHEGTEGYVDILKEDLDAEARRVGAHTVHEKRAVLLRMVGDRLKTEMAKRLPAGQPEPSAPTDDITCG